MAIIEIAVGKSKYKIDCSVQDHEKILHLAKKLDDKIKKNFSGLNIDEKTALVITALTLEDELEALNPSNEAHKQEAENKIDESEIYEALTENVENITNYIEALAKKIENY